MPIEITSVKRVYPFATDCLHPKTKQPITVGVNAYYKPA